MTSFPTPPECLSPETLALAASGDLSPAERARVQTHLARCADCYEIFSDLVAMRESVGPAVAPSHSTGAAPASAPASAPAPAATPPAPASRRHRWLAIGGLAAAVLAAAVMTPWLASGPDRDVNRALGALARSVGTDRPALGRVSGDFAWGAPPAITRGAGTTALPLAVQDAVLDIRKLVAANRTARTLDAAGVASLVSGDIDASLASLDEAVELDPSDVRARVDQSAARIEKWRRTQAASDAVAALDAAQRALQLDGRNALARFNHALAVEALGMSGQAAESWNAYLALDPSSKWADEARAHIARLKGSTPAPLPAPATSTEADLRRLAAESPMTIERYVRDEWMPSWRKPPPASPEIIATGRRLAAALVQAGRDRMWPDLISAAIATPPDTPRGHCISAAADKISATRVAFDQSKSAEAERLARDAKTQFACAGLPTFEADGEIAWSTFFQDQPLPPAAALDALVRAAESRGYWRAAGRIEYVRGLGAERLTQFSDSQDHMSRALQNFQRAVETEALASTWVQLGEIAANVDEFGDAWQRFAHPLSLLDGLEQRRRHIALTVASLVASRQRLAGAAAFLADTLVSAEIQTVTDPTFLTGSFIRQAESRVTMGDFAGAAAALDRADQSRRSLSDATFKTQYAGDISALRGVVLRQTDPGRSIAAFTTAIDIFDGTRRPLRGARLLLDRGRAYRAKGDDAAAERDWLAGMTRFEDTRPEIRDAQQRIDREDQLWDLFRELISARASDAVRSLEVAERFRGRALLDAISSRSATPATPLAGPALYEWLPANTAAVAYAVLPDQLIRWTISPGGVRVVSQPVKPREIGALVDSFRGSLTSRNPDALSAADANRLGALLVPDDLPAGTTRLMVLPDAALFAVPFPALPIPGSSDLVVDRYVVSIAPSLTTARAGMAAIRASQTITGGGSAPLRDKETTDEERQPARLAGRSPLALLVASAEPQPREALPALPGAAAEIDALRSIYRNPIVLTGAAATASAMLRDLPRADVVHFAGHAIADAAVPSRARLLLSPAGSPSVISFDDLRRTPFKPGAIVVLSACDALQGKVFRAEGAVGLAYPFLANGAASVIASLWQIDDATPASFWEQFHRDVRSGLSPDAALAASQRAGRKAGVVPAVWAAFEAVGGLSRQ